MAVHQRTPNSCGSPVRSTTAGVGEAQTGGSRRAFGEGRSEHAGGDVVVVMDLGGALARVGSQDATRVLDQSAFEGDWRRQKKGVEAGAVEPPPDVRTSPHDQERWATGEGLQSLQRGGPHLDPHPTAPHNGATTFAA